MEGFIEKRQFPRHVCQKAVDFVVRKRCLCGCITNISKTGAFIEAKGFFELGDAVSMTFQTNHPVLTFEKVAGSITRIAPECFGVSFSEPVWA